MRLLFTFVLMGVLGLAGCAREDAAPDATTGNGDAAQPADTVDGAQSSAAGTDTGVGRVAPPTLGGGSTTTGGAAQRPAASVLGAADASQQIVTEPTTLMDGKVTVQLPKVMRPMTEQELSLKYPGETRPDVAYTDSTTTVNLTMTHEDRPLLPGQIYEWHKLYEAGMKSLDRFKHADWISNEQVTVDGRNCFLMQFRNQLTDHEVYNMLLGTSLDDRFLIVTFTLPRGLEGQWLNKGKEILLTAKFHPEQQRAESAAAAVD